MSSLLTHMRLLGFLSTGLLLGAICLLPGGGEVLADQDTGIGIAGPGDGGDGAREVGDIIHEIPCPGTDGRGLTWDGAYLWYVDDATHLIYKLDPDDGSILHSFPAPGTNYREGLAWDGAYLWHAEYNTGTVYKIDPADGTVVTSFTGPTSYPTGLTWDGTDLWTASYRDWQIYRFSSLDGTLLQSFDPPDACPWGVAWSTRFPSLWHGNYEARPVYELDPVDGTVISSFGSPPGSWFLGMTWDGSTLWVVDNVFPPRIVQIDLGQDPSDVREDPRETTPLSWGRAKQLFRVGE